MKKCRRRVVEYLLRYVDKGIPEKESENKVNTEDTTMRNQALRQISKENREPSNEQHL